MPTGKGSHFPEANVPEEILKAVIKKVERRRSPELSYLRDPSPARAEDSDDQESSSTDDNTSESVSEMPSPANSSTHPLDIAQASSPTDFLPWEASPPQRLPRGIDAELPPDSSLTRNHTETYGENRTIEPANGHSPENMSLESASEDGRMDIDETTADEIPANVASSPPVNNCERDATFQSQHLAFKHELDDVQVQETPYACKRKSDHLLSTSHAAVSPQKQNSSGKTTSTTTIPCTYQDGNETGQIFAKPRSLSPEQPESIVMQETSRDISSNVLVPTKRPLKSPLASEKRSKRHRKIKSSFNFDDEDPVPRNPSLGVLHQRQAFIEKIKRQSVSDTITTQMKQVTPFDLTGYDQVGTIQERTHSTNPEQQHHLDKSPSKTVNLSLSKAHSTSSLSSQPNPVSLRKETEGDLHRQQLSPQNTGKPAELAGRPVLPVHPRNKDRPNSGTTTAIHPLKSPSEGTKESTLRAVMTKAVEPSARSMSTSTRLRAFVVGKESNVKLGSQHVKRSWHEDSNTPFKLFAGRYARLKSFNGRMGHSARDGDPIERSKPSLDVLAWSLRPPGGAKE